MLRRLIVLFLSLSFCWTTAACGDSTTKVSQQNNSNQITSAPSRIADGKYPVQQATYDDVDGQYSLMLLNTPAGTPPVYNTSKLQMARLSDEEIKAGEKTYLKVENNQPVMYLTEDFQIAYVHNVTETRNNPQTGQTETVIVRQQSSFWTPFAGAIAGQMVANMLFTPQYYVPPIYQPGVPMTGFGGYGNTYTQAVDSYQSRYQKPPAAVKNRQVLRTTGSINKTRTTSTRRNSSNSSKATGSGFGSSKLRSSGKSKSPASKRRSGFGSSAGSRSRGFSSGRRRR